MKIKWWHIGLLVSLLVAVVSPLASSSPDGLEKVAENQGFLEKAQETTLALFPGYLFPGITDEAVATILSGLIGTLVLFGAVYGIAWLVRSKRERLNNI